MPGSGVQTLTVIGYLLTLLADTSCILLQVEKQDTRIPEIPFWENSNHHALAVDGVLSYIISHTLSSLSYTKSHMPNYSFINRETPLGKKLF